MFFLFFKLFGFFHVGQGPKPRKSRAPKGGAPKGGAPKGGAPKGGGGAKICAFFPLPSHICALFVSLWVSSRGILVVFEAPGRSNVHVWSCKANLFLRFFENFKSQSIFPNYDYKFFLKF